ncbi:hypothetical protein [Micromonospora sp. M61]|uniref:hypothetical protein n=1 Tax=Micromonospora sp. M61 TaxID=2824890 RepID=UPI001B3875EB|nr:hypothetical protein [Micromonospora sp. M61]MBQ0978737.1 hypothetical protein [Micromonospora sp. M61]
MLPVAFTCPLWWVARWATRVLTSLAVVAALALGAGPASAAAPTPTAAATPTAAPTPTVHAAPAVAEGAAEKAFPVCSVDSHPAVVAGVPLVCAARSERLPLVDGPRSWAPRAPPGR